MFVYLNSCKSSTTSCLKQIEDWRKLDQMVREDVDILKRLWKEMVTERLGQVRLGQHWSFLSKGGNLHRKEIDEEVLTPSSVVSVAIGE